MVNAKLSEVRSGRIEHHSLLFKLCMLGLFLLAALIRWDEIKAPGLLLDREYTSAIFARAFYFLGNDGVEDWRRDIAVRTMKQQPVLEPPLLEYLVASIYRVVGREELYYSRYLTSTFWLIGGLFMYKIARRFLTTEGAVFATIYYLFVPTGVLISRSFQPDSLMMLLFLASLYLLVSYFESPSISHLLQASVVTATVLLLRPLIIFAVFFAFLAMSLQVKRYWGKVFDRPLMIFSSISLIPAAAYYGYGMIWAGFMRWKFANSFMPHLLIKKGFWAGWFHLGANVIGISMLVAAIIGFFLLQNRRARHLIVGLAVGYFFFGLAFTYHIHTHSYYHIQLFPLIGICAGACLASITNTLRNTSIRFWLVPVILTLPITVYFSHRAVRQSLYQDHMENPKLAWKIGEAVNHSPNTVFVSRYYGLPLEYYGEFGGAPWPVRIEDPFYRSPGARELSVQERIDALGFSPEYFIVTHFDLFQRKHQDLQAYLETSCSERQETGDYLIYGRCQTLSRK